MTGRPKNTLEKVFSRPYETNDQGCWLWAGGSFHAFGYGLVCIEYVTYALHRLSYERYVGPIGGLEVCHRCDTPRCYNPDHLFLGSRKDNQADMAAKGRAQRGVARPAAKLTDADIREIRRLYTLPPRRGRTPNAAKHRSSREVARMFGVASSLILLIAHGKAWKHAQ